MREHIVLIKRPVVPRWLRIAFLLVLAVAGFGSTIAGASQETSFAFNCQNLVRLHVLAHSDSPEDQRVKLLVRDRVLVESQKWLIGVDNTQEALRIIEKKKASILRTVLDELRQNHKNYGAHLETGVFPFPVRDYPFGRLPAGNYRALRIVLGKGQGHNWWCVLFPPLCFVAKDPKDREDYRVSQGKVIYRSEFLERVLQRNHIKYNGFWRGWSRFFEKSS